MPEIKFKTTRENLVNKQICVKKGYSDNDLEEIVRLLEPSGTNGNWSINLELKRVECVDDSNNEHVCFTC